MIKQTAQGEVGYLYDNARRRQTMTVVGQPTVSYGWDNANRLTGITQGTTSIPFGYDNANRKSTMTLPNGILLTYTYDNDSRVTAMTWTLAGNPVGDLESLTRDGDDLDAGGQSGGHLEYSYDADGRVIQKTGSFAQTGLPQAVTGNTFNAANEMTSFNGTPQTYDANGNLANDGTNTYSWDARNHLVGITGSSTSTFVYDAFGRRTNKTIAGTATQLLYDGLNPVQEIQNGAPSANLLTGLGVDEYLQPTDASGPSSYLTDALASTLALANSAGALATSYTYDPFGATAAAGSSSNPYQFTGRENDGTGLNYFRARYYESQTQRFVSQDPLDFKARTTDLYSYVSNDPQDLVDPLGLYSCYYSIQLHTLICAADVPTDPGGISDDFVSGTTASGCQNNPSQECQNTYNAGPIPEGDYVVGPGYSTGGYPRHNLSLVPGESLPPNRTGGFEFHGCGDPGTCSIGCMAAHPDNPTLFLFDLLFDLEPGSTVHVGP